MEIVADTSVAAMRRRLIEGLDGRTLQWLCGAVYGTTDTRSKDYKNIQRWLGSTDEEKNAPPAAFLGRFCLVTETNPRWLLTGLGGRREIPGSLKERAFDRIAELVEEVRASPRIDGSSGAPSVVEPPPARTADVVRASVPPPRKRRARGSK